MAKTMVEQNNLETIYYPGPIVRERGALVEDLSRLESEIAKYEAEHGEIPLRKDIKPLPANPTPKEQSDYYKLVEMSFKKYVGLLSLRIHLDFHKQRFPDRVHDNMYEPMTI